MKKVNNLILMLASLQASILVNANSRDDDLEDSWQAMKDDYEALKIAMDRYIRKGEE